MVVLEQQGGGLGVVLAGGDVQGGQAHFPFSVVLQKNGDHLVVALLQGDGQGGEAVLEVTRKKTSNSNRSRFRTWFSPSFNSRFNSQTR